MDMRVICDSEAFAQNGQIGEAAADFCAIR
jgi:hypothetical protein